MIKNTLALSLGVSLGLWAAAASADIYRCVMADGKTTYSDEKCDGGTAAAANITATLAVCSTDQCRAELAHDRSEAVERLQQERAALAQLHDARLKREAGDAEAALRDAQSKRLALLEGQLADSREAGVYYPAYANWHRCYPNCGGKGPGTHPRPHPGPKPVAPASSFR